MVNAVTQQQLDNTLSLFDKYGNEEIDFGELLGAINDQAALILSKQKLINFTVTEMVSGRFRIRATATDALSPLGKQRITEIKRAQ
ncbi:hypothetical protein [Pseudomonas sp.]|uniref:hypothetical protein n=1 Tax=Pseudomonas sp. TaxID=306 RepID=UPI00262CB765|nr:hypothetical protein [Pseudomonas sp.]